MQGQILLCKVQFSLKKEIKNNREQKFWNGCDISSNLTSNIKRIQENLYTSNPPKIIRKPYVY